MVQTPAGNIAMTAEMGTTDPITAAWEPIRSGLRRDCGPRTFDGWLRPIALGGFDSDTGTLRLELPSQFMADWVQTHFAERLALAWRQRFADVRQIRSGVGPAAPRTAAIVEIPASATSTARARDLSPIAHPTRPRLPLLT